MTTDIAMKFPPQHQKSMRLLEHIILPSPSVLRICFEVMPSPQPQRAPPPKKKDTQRLAFAARVGCRKKAAQWQTTRVQRKLVTGKVDKGLSE